MLVIPPLPQHTHTQTHTHTSINNLREYLFWRVSKLTSCVCHCWRGSMDENILKNICFGIISKKLGNEVHDELALKPLLEVLLRLPDKWFEGGVPQQMKQCERLIITTRRSHTHTHTHTHTSNILKRLGSCT
eukprot:GHVR01178783.1.p1 GENE.GHVR01178783.1~~GHVR01178783.1.p1  ORF type:complete len:132 (-),score=56.66 GHVR01178783.1:161-556(-)